ncbi:DUF4142 domain-containing protein [Streptomyces sp. NPDC046831]|uniref:DUF4142 domain-containing protein n=1 Tax=Streptomyces sp. NPDC046831 TaxID=3154805 RepID=UPI0034018A51
MHARPVAAAVAAVALCGISVPQAFAVDGTSQDATFLIQAHQGNLAETAAGEDTLNHATSQCVKEVGAVLVRDHRRLDTDVSALAGKLKVKLPASPSAEQRKQLAAVQAKAGSAAYDAAWLTAQDAAHRKTLALIDQEIRAGRNAQIVAAARSARPVVAMHLDMVRGGTCRAAQDTGTIRADTAGRLPAGEGSSASAGTVGLAGGGLLAAGAAAWLLRTRQRSADVKR